MAGEAPPVTCYMKALDAGALLWLFPRILLGMTWTIAFVLSPHERYFASRSAIRQSRQRGKPGRGAPYAPDKSALLEALDCG